MEKENFRKIEIDITNVKRREEEIEEVEKLKKEALQRLELFGFDYHFLEELERDFKPKVADGEISRDMNKREEEILKKIYLKLLNPRSFFPYYITEYWDCGKHYLAILFIRRTDEQFDFFKRLIKSTNCVRAITCDITDPKNIILDEDGIFSKDQFFIMERVGDAIYPIWAEEEIWEKVNKSYEEQRRNNKCSHTRVYRSALTGEIIKTEPII